MTHHGYYLNNLLLVCCNAYMFYYCYHTTNRIVFNKLFLDAAKIKYAPR